ncbi:MAG: ABC transporter permease [Caldilineaceae bacterium]
MAQFFLRRLAFVLFILFFISLLVFAVTEILPGDAAQMILGQKATPQTLAALRTRLGLDQPAPVRYLTWIGGVLRGDWGESLIMKMPIGPLLAQRLSNSAVLALLAWVLSTVLGIWLGVLAGLYRDRWPDRLISLFVLFFVSFPPFVIAIFLIIVFTLWLRWLPASSMISANANLLMSLRFLILPTITLTLGALAEVARLVRANLIEVLESDYIRTAKSKGLSDQLIVLRHALRNALLPAISVLALNIGYLMSGSVLVENLFAYPGLGRLLLQAISQRDLPLLQAATLVAALIFVLANLMADMVYFWVNPRIRYS